MSFAHERRSRRMVELEAAELHAARERSERFERRAAASASPRRVRRRGRFWNRTYAPIEVESLPPELEAASLLRGAYDTTPRVPPGLGGERWETWRHVPTVVSPHDDVYDDDDAAVPASAPPGLNPHAAPVASVVGKVTAKCYEVDTRDPKRVAQILRENRERIANEDGNGTASDAATDAEADSSESEVELEPSRTIKSRVFHDKTTRVPTQPEGSMRVVATVRDTRGVEMLPPPPPDAHFDAIAKFRRARHDKEAERRRRARERSRERAEAAARRREEKRLAEEEKRAARTAAKDAKVAARNAAKDAEARTASSKASSDSESERASNPEPASPPATPRKKLPRLPRGFRRRDDAASTLRGAWASACVRSLRHGAVHLRSGAARIRGAAVHSAVIVGKSLHDAGHAVDAAVGSIPNAVGSVARNVTNASVNTWRSVRDSDLAKSVVVATRGFFERRPWEPHLERCSWNVATPPAVSVRVGPARGPGWFRVLKVGPRSFPDLTPPIAPAAVEANETRHASGTCERERSMAILVKAAGVPVAAKTPADALRMLGMEVRNAGNAVRNSSLRTLEFTLDSAAKTVGAASRTVGGAAEGVGRTLFSAAERLAQRTEFYEELDIDMDDPDAPWPNGCYEDLEGYTHKAEAWAVTPHWSKGMRVPPEESEDDEEEEFIRSLEPKEARYRDAEDIAAMMLDAGDDYDSYGNDDSYSYRPSRRHSPRQQPKPPRPSFNAPLSPLPPQPTEAEDDEYRHLSPLFVPPEEPRGAEEGAVPLRSLRLDDYEESLATRVRMLQKSFPEVAQEIADAVYDYAGKIGKSGAPGEAPVAASGMSRTPVDVAAATRVVQELEAASMSVLMHGKIPTGETLRAWLDDVVEGRGMGRQAWREDNDEFFRGGSHSGSASKGFSSLDNQETQYSLSPTMEVRAPARPLAGRTDGAGDADVAFGAFTPVSKKFVSDIAGAFEGWAGREPRISERHDGGATFTGPWDPREEAARVMEDEARSRRFIRAWHAECHEGPIANAVRGIEHERFEKSPATAVKGAFAAAERAIERVENVSKFFADTDDSSMEISRDEVAAAGVQSPEGVKSPPRATRKPWDFSDSSQSDIEVDPATPAPEPKPLVAGAAAAVEGGSGRKPGARVIGGLLSPFRTIKNGLKMLSQQNSPEIAVKPTQTAPVSETTSLPVSSAVSESPPASPSVENASEESVNAASASVSVSESASRSPSGSLTGSPSFVAAVEASEEKIVASARDAITSRFAGKDLEDALVADDDDDSDSGESPMRSARSKGPQPTVSAMSTGGSSMVTARTGGSVAFSGGPGFSNGGWSATKTIYFDDESPGGTASVSKPTMTGHQKTVIKRPSSVAKKATKMYEDESDEDEFESDRLSRFPRAIGDKTMDEMLDALDKDLESSMEESPGPVRFNPFRFKGFANNKTADKVDASADKENEENSGGNSSGNTTDSDTKEWRKAVDRAKSGAQYNQGAQRRVAAFGKVSSPLKPSRVRSPARELAGYGSARAAFEREASRLDASMDRGSRRRR